MTKVKISKTTKKQKTATSKTASTKKTVKAKTASTKKTVKAKTASTKKTVKAKTASTKKTVKAKIALTKSKGKSRAAGAKKVLKSVVFHKKKTPTVKKQKKKQSLREKKIQEIKLNLLSQKNSLLNEAEEALNELPGQTVFPDLGDQASAETDRNFMLRLRGREQRLLKKIEEALERIDSGTFGICEDCGNEIGAKRLEARPVTTMCIECKTLQEEEEKLRAS
jgi:DnaK suppressor protein